MEERSNIIESPSEEGMSQKLNLRTEAQLIHQQF
jgi:hypothetical protein